MAGTFELIERKKLTEGTHTSHGRITNMGENSSAITLWVDNEVGTGTYSLVMEDSPDGRNWATVCTPIASTSLTTAVLTRGTVPSTTDFGGFVRFKITVSNTGAIMSAWAHFKAK